MFVTQCDTLIDYVNEKGYGVNLAPLNDFWLEKASEELKNNLYTSEQANRDGALDIGDSLGVRTIKLEGFFNGGDFDRQKNELTRVFNPKLKGTMTYTNKNTGTSRTISCKVMELPLVYFAKRVCRFEVNLQCSDPFWKGRETTVGLALMVKLFKFPLIIPRNGIVFARRSNKLETTFENLGDVESGFSVTFNALSGTVRNPQVQNKATGEFIKVNYTMARGDTIEIINYPLLKRIIINGSINGFRYENEDSKWFPMTIGTNTFGYFADENLSNLVGTVQYTPFYLMA